MMDNNPSPEIAQRRERVFLLLAGIFLGTLAMLNILGISRFIKLFTLNFDGTGDIVLEVEIPGHRLIGPVEETAHELASRIQYGAARVPAGRIMGGQEIHG